MRNAGVHGCGNGFLFGDAERAGAHRRLRPEPSEQQCGRDTSGLANRPGWSKLGILFSISEFSFDRANRRDLGLSRCSDQNVLDPTQYIGCDTQREHIVDRLRRGSGWCNIFSDDHSELYRIFRSHSKFGCGVRPGIFLERRNFPNHPQPETDGDPHGAVRANQRRGSDGSGDDLEQLIEQHYPDQPLRYRQRDPWFSELHQ